MARPTPREQQEERPPPAVRFTKGLLKRLSGRNEVQKRRYENPPEVAVGGHHPQKPSPSSGARHSQLPLGFHSGLFPGLPQEVSAEEQLRAEQCEKNLAPIRVVLEQAAKLKEEIARDEEQQVDKIKNLAKELHSKEYKAPQRPPQCVPERQACIDCYKASKDPMECSASVQAFVECARRAHQNFVEGGKL